MIVIFYTETYILPLLRVQLGIILFFLHFFSLFYLFLFFFFFFILFLQWEMPIPIYNTLMKLPASPPRDLVYIYIAKAVELNQAKVWMALFSKLLLLLYCIICLALFLSI